MDSYESQWEFEKSIMTALNIQNMDGIAKIQITLEAHKIPILTITRIVKSEVESIASVLEKYDIHLTPKES
jgi:hypothetical protein